MGQAVLAWVLQVGVSVPLLPATPREPWCDFGAHAAALAGVPVAQDPVFRLPSPQAKARFGVVRKLLAAGKPAPDLAKLLAEPDGPAVARLALGDADPAVLRAALPAAMALAVQHPRLAANAVGHVMHPVPEVAQAAIQLTFATGCDAPALYALDALRHPDEAVHLAVLAALDASIGKRRDIGLAARLLTWLDEGGGSARARLSAIRMLGQHGWLPATPVLQKLVKGTRQDEAAEAFVALAVVTPLAVAADVQRWCQDKAAVKRAAGLRAAAQVAGPDAEAQVRRLLADRAPGADPLDPSVTVADVATKALGWLRME